MATRTIKSAAGKSDLTAAAVRTVVRKAAAGRNDVIVVAGRTGEFRTESRKAAAGVQKASRQGAAGAGRKKH